jgi:trimethylamine---corrinoid protein Co-methyltransferase
VKNGMRAGFKALEGMSLNLFSDDELDEIHQATLRVLKETGVRVLAEDAQDYFYGGGCEVDRTKSIVKIPANVVEDAVRSAPSNFLLAGIDPAEDFWLKAGSSIAFTNFGEGVEVIDPFTRKRHRTTKKDVANVTRMCTAMDQVDFLERPVGANDVPSHVQQIHNAEAVFNNTTKHSIIGSGDAYKCKKIIELASAICGGNDKFRERPIYSANTCPNSPLILNPDTTGVIIEAAKGGAPCSLVDMFMAGATAPVTLAGAMVIQNAELLSAIVLAQLVRKGHPCIYGTSSLSFDLRTTTSPVGAPQLALVSAATAKMAQYYKLPSWAAGG